MYIRVLSTLLPNSDYLFVYHTSTADHHERQFFTYLQTVRNLNEIIQEH